MSVADSVLTETPDADVLRAMYSHMVRARTLDERIWLLNRQGRAPFWVSGMGHEAIQVACAVNLRPGHDWVVPYYRDLALVLALGMTPKDHLLSALAKSSDPNSGGRQMPAHYGCRRLNIVSTGSVVATQVLHAAGVALALKIKGSHAVCVVCLGEGATSQGDFHEGLNFAAVHQVPMICVVENNGYAISVPWQKQMRCPDVAARAAGYGMPSAIVDGGDAIACLAAAREAIDRARGGGGPTLVEAKVHRLTSHSSDDDERRYRHADAIAETKRQDCVPRFRLALEGAEILRPGDVERIAAEMLAEVDRDLVDAEDAPDPDPGTVRDHVYGGGSWQ